MGDAGPKFTKVTPVRMCGTAGIWGNRKRTMQRAGATIGAASPVGKWFSAIAAIAVATPAIAAHSGVIAPRTGFAWSDVAAFAAFVFMIVLARRAIRKRKRKD